MKKRRIGSLLLSLAMTAQLLSVSALAYPVPDYGPQPGTEKFQDGVPMSVSCWPSSPAWTWGSTW